uniref:Secreted protein n=1 Tax=Setaria digitata TaxID=48799 RepID=A0A915PNF2_9BILA
MAQESVATAAVIAVEVVIAAAVLQWKCCWEQLLQCSSSILEDLLLLKNSKHCKLNFSATGAY